MKKYIAYVSLSVLRLKNYVIIFLLSHTVVPTFNQRDDILRYQKIPHMIRLGQKYDLVIKAFQSNEITKVKNLP